MRFYCLAIMIMLTLTVAAYSQPVEIRRFTGLDTRTSDRVVEPTYFRVADNVDFGRTVGEASKRRGYSLVSSVDKTSNTRLYTQYDSLTSLYAAYLNDGKQALVFSLAIDSVDIHYDSRYRWGRICVSPFGSSEVDTGGISWSGAFGYDVTSIYPYWPLSSPTSYAMVSNKVYAVNGVSRGMVADLELKHAATWPLTPFGAPEVTPIAHSATTPAKYELNGEYRYLIRSNAYKNGTLYRCSSSVVTSPVKADGEHILLRNFSYPPVQYFSVTYPSDSADLIFFEVWRTKANPGTLDKADSVWRVPDAGGLTTFGSCYDSCGGVTWIDSIPDSMLTEGIPMIDDERVGVSSDFVYTRRYGAPTYISASTGAYARADSSKEYIWGGGPGANMDVVDTNIFPKAYAYAVTYYDTLLKIDSDTSRSFFIYQPSSGKLRTVRVGIPPLPSGSAHTVRRLYRSMLMNSGRDTSIAVQTYCNTDKDQLQTTWSIVNQQINKVSEISTGNKWIDIMANNMPTGTQVGDNYYLGEIHRSGDGWCFDKLQRTYTRDTLVMTPYIMVDEIHPDSVAYTDATRFDSLIQHQWYKRTPPPPFMTQVVSLGKYVIGVEGNRIYQSLQDSGGFGVFSSVSVDGGDGDYITLLRQSRGLIRAYKNRKSYNVYTNESGQLGKYEQVNGLGCIAPQSGVLTPYGFAYLSPVGVVLENDGLYLSGTVTSPIISGRLKNFDDIPIETKSKAVGAYTDNKYLLYFPEPIDTTFTYDFQTNTWATWDVPLGGTTVYGAEGNVSKLPGDTLFFYKPGGSSLYSFGTSELDDTDTITVTLKTVPLLANGDINTIQHVGVWTSIGDTSDAACARLAGSISTENGVLSPPVVYTNNMCDPYQKRGLADGFYGRYFQLSFVRKLPYQFSLGGIDIFWRRLESIEDGPAH